MKLKLRWPTFLWLITILVTFLFTPVSQAQSLQAQSAQEQSSQEQSSQEQGAQEDPSSDPPIADEVTEEASEETAAKNEASAPVPSADNLRARDLGDALQNFRPSEEISADNAVPFPVDI